MSNRRTNNEDPTPEQVAAYVDGELPEAQRAGVEAWLAHHAEGQAEVEAQRRLERLWQNAAPPEPDEEAWARVLAGVQAAVPPGRRRRPLHRTSWPLWVTGLTAAAALLAAFLVVRPGTQQRVAPLPVASGDDIEIISIDARDGAALVVGDPPVRGRLEVASAADVTVDDTGHDVEVVIPDLELPGSSAPPMLMVPFDLEAGRER